MALKNDAKFGEELTCCFKIDMRDWANFGPNTGKSKKLHFNEFLLSKVYILVELKKYRGVIFHDNEE